jgi:tRNA dimethylallyltransferase
MEVISADSMQVYRYMDIATAKPSEEELSSLPHHLIDVVNPDEQFQAGMFVKMAQDKISEIRCRGKIPVVVGGTGLYIKALIYGLAPAPGRSEKIRQALKKLMDKRGIGYLESILMRLDPASSSQIKKNDATRVIRSLEIAFQTGQRPSSINSLHGFQHPRYEAKIACMMPDRGLLYQKIDARVLKMVEYGLLDETKKLLDMGYDPELHSMRTLAYKHIVTHLKEKTTLGEAVWLIQRDTRRFAKRQVTWIKSMTDHTIFKSMGEAYDEVSGWMGTFRCR